jgi:hypothetical protein
VTPARFRKLALALEGVVERPHMDRTAFRTKRKIFATLGDDLRVNLVIEPHARRQELIRAQPDVFYSLGGWTRLGYVAVDLARVDDALLHALLEDAWRGAQPVARRRKK